MLYSTGGRKVAELPLWEGEFIRDVEPGEILVFSEQGVVSKKEHCNKKDKKLCIFEYIYFSRPDSVIDGVSVHASRVRAGEILA